MKTLKKILFGICLFLLIFMVNYGISWVITCGIYALICFCFHIEFNWLTATGVWLILMLMKTIFKGEGKSNGK